MHQGIHAHTHTHKPRQTDTHTYIYICVCVCNNYIYIINKRTSIYVLVYVHIMPNVWFGQESNFRLRQPPFSRLNRHSRQLSESHISETGKEKNISLKRLYVFWERP